MRWSISEACAIFRACPRYDGSGCGPGTARSSSGGFEPGRPRNGAPSAPGSSSARLAACRAGPAGKYSLSLPTVQRWLNRYEAEGLAGLEDRPRPGRQRTRITPEVEAEIVRGTLEEAPPRGTHWSTRLMAGAAGLHHSQVARIWRAHGLKPHLARTFKLSTDPEFVEKLRDVVGLYVDPPERAVVLAFDEKSRIQALDRAQPGLPFKKGRRGTMTHDYKRHGTTDLVRGAGGGHREGDPRVHAAPPAPGVPPLHGRGREADRSGTRPSRDSR